MGSFRKIIAQHPTPAKLPPCLCGVKKESPSPALTLAASVTKKTPHYFVCPSLIFTRQGCLCISVHSRPPSWADSCVFLRPAVRAEKTGPPNRNSQGGVLLQLRFLYFGYPSMSLCVCGWGGASHYGRKATWQIRRKRYGPIHLQQSVLQEAPGRRKFEMTNIRAVARSIFWTHTAH